MKLLTVDFRKRLSDNTTQHGRKEFGRVPPNQVMGFVKLFLEDETMDVQITYEEAHHARKRIVGTTASQIIVDDPLKPDYDAQLAELMKGKREGGFA